MGFAALQDRANAAVMDRLADAATVNGASVTGMFNNGFADAFSMDGSQPSLTCLSSVVAAVVRGNPVVRNGVNYTVSNIQPDGIGFTKLLLEKA